MKRILIGILIFLLYLACVIGGAFVLHFSGVRFALFCVVLGLLGGAAIAFAIWYMSRMAGDAALSGGADSVNLDVLVRDANRKLRAGRLGIRSIATAQIIYLVGEDNSAKTQTVLQSGLDAELLAGNLFRDGVVAPTQLANLWLAGSSVVVEAGGALLRQPALWQRLVKATRPGRFRSLFSKRARLPARAVVLCVSAERIPGPSEAGYDAQQIRASAQTLNQRLRELSQTLGISLPVYVLFTKLDTVGHLADLQHFADYVARLSAEEVKIPLGSLLAPVEAGSGLYAERATTLVGNRLDELIYSLSEFRVEVLARGGEPKMLASAYEFPRDLRKRRDTIIDFLVELTRPSQLGINPFLRGFFFSGMRAVVVEEVIAAAAQPQRPVPVDSGATGFFSVGDAQLQRLQQQPQRLGSRKVPQWVFLPHLFSNLLLKDKSAFEASRSSAKVNVLKRVLLSMLCACIFMYFILLTISFFNNRELAQEVSAAATVPVFAASSTQFAATRDLQTLDHLGDLVLQLDTYRIEGAPLMDRWGLYTGNSLLPIACDAYALKFRALLLGPTQANILAQLRAVQSPPQAGADYNAIYNPLKAYLITTSNPEKSTLDFLPAALVAAWAGNAATPVDLTQLAQTQFKTYATLLAESQSCMSAIGGQPDHATVDHARDYLSHFGGSQHIYQNMLANANSKNPAVHYNDNPNYPNSAHYIVDPYVVPGAFTKPGFSFMANAIQHPQTYYNGDEWVLGPNAGPGTDAATLSGQIQKLYVADYLAQWRAYLNAAHFVGFQNWNDAAAKLDALDSPSSAILQLFSLISINTGVAQPDIANAFQAPQSVVPPTNPGDRFTSPLSQPYITALQGLEQAVKSVSQNPASATDPNAGAPVISAAGTADQAAEALRNNFNPDPDGKMDAVSFARLEDPIKSAIALARTKIDPAGGGGATFCGQANAVLGKFPFNPQSPVQATPDEVAAIFAGQGPLYQLSLKISQLVMMQGGQYVTNPASGIEINPAFLRFFNAAEKVSSALFPAGTTQPTLTFNLTEVKTPGVPDAVLTIDAQQLTSAGQTIPVHWTSQVSSKITLQGDPDPITGPWSIFKLGFLATHPTPNRLEYTISFQGHTNEVLHFDAEGSGAALLNPSFMGQLQHCVATVAKP